MELVLFVLVLVLGVLSMGLQLLASRVLAPFFGNSIFVWASLITTFLAAFSTGSFVGGAVSGRPLAWQRGIVFTLMAICTSSLLMDSLASYALATTTENLLECVTAKQLLACGEAADCLP
jgi:hypothetical protein